MNRTCMNAQLVRRSCDALKDDRLGWEGGCGSVGLASIEEERGERLNEALDAVEAFDLAAAVVPAAGALVVVGIGPHSFADGLDAVAVEIGDGSGLAFDADGDVPGGIDIEEGPSRAT